MDKRQVKVQSNLDKMPSELNRQNSGASFDEPVERAQTHAVHPTNTLSPTQPKTKQNLQKKESEKQTSESSPVNVKMRAKLPQVKNLKREDLLADHQKAYMQHKQQFEEDYNSEKWDYKYLVEEFQQKPIKCVKYNYSFDPDVQNFMQNDGLISISEDGKDLNITLKKYCEAPIHILEPDRHLIKQQRKDYAKQVAANKKIMAESLQEKLKLNPEDPELQKQLKIYLEVQPDKHDDATDLAFENLAKEDKEAFQAKLDEKKEIERLDNLYRFEQSSCSINLDEIQGFIYGGFSSRFWVYRKHLCCIDYEYLQRDTYKRKFRDGKSELPFYSWQCITLDYGSRQVDLVIKNQQSMDFFIKFLIYSINTMDCYKGSAELYIVSAYQHEINYKEKRLRKAAMKKYNENNTPIRWKDIELPEEVKDGIKWSWRKRIFKETIYKMKLMRIRAKIAFQAFQNRQAINELLIHQVLESYMVLTESGSIPQIADYPQECIDQFDDLLYGDISGAGNTMPKLIDFNLDPVLRDRKRQKYIERELKELGLNSLNELAPEFQKNLYQILDRNKQDDEDQNVADKNKKNFDESTAKPGGASAIKSLGIFDKSKCPDVFNEVVVEGMNMYEQRSDRVKLQMKFNTLTMNAQLQKIKFMCNFGCLIDTFFLKATLQKIHLQKKMFVLELEAGMEVYIPQELSIDNYPKAFQYYDPIVQIINSMFSQDNQVYHQLKCEFNLDKIKGSDWIKDLLVKVGVYENPKKPLLFTKHKLINENIMNEIDHMHSPHSIALQKSRYILIESTEQRLTELAKMEVHQTEHKDDDFDKYLYSVLREQAKSTEDRQLQVRFCRNDEVTAKRQKFIRFKQTYFQRADHLKNNGQKFGTSKKIQSYVNINIEALYKARAREPPIGENGKPDKKQFYQQFKRTEINEQKNLDLIDPKLLTGRQKNLLAKDKRLYAEWLMEKGERLCIDRRAKIRVNRIECIYDVCQPGVGYNQKNQYLEESIQATNKYFDHLSDIVIKKQKKVNRISDLDPESPCQPTLMEEEVDARVQLEEIKKQFFKISRKIRKLEEEGKLKRADPWELLTAGVNNQVQVSESAPVGAEEGQGIIDQSKHVLQTIAENVNE